ncbi:M48 family metallopeptidase [Paenisporosarcina quisquiliarum]|uniref:M48 family metallopeptidase n=1 Tax=Paenisporosarcina quisquiliarum TaxID=365346 RepID=A0A9X3LIX3_9BACL|nr:M48 family metallopeptidase [Paenisporosarcina quisquiliarum]
MRTSNVTSERETIYFVLSLIFSIFIYIIAAISIIGIGIAIGLLALVLYANMVMLGSIRGNGIRIRENQFPDVYERVVSLSGEMGLKRIPDVFIVQSEGALNAFATRFLGRDMVVIYSEVFELARQGGAAELDFIIAHELAHIKRRHVWKNILLVPATFIPFLSQAYSRSCEYTCDREAAFYTQNGTAAKRALTILGAGKDLYHEVNESAYLEQIKSESNVAVWFSEVLSSHPRLPKRIQSVGQFMRVEGTPSYEPKNGKIVLGASLLFGGMFGVYLLIVFLFSAGGLVYASFIPSLLSEDTFDLSEEDYYPSEGETPLMTAAYDGDIEEVNALIEQGADLEEKDAEGYTALGYAGFLQNNDVAQVLLDAGADPNAQSDYSTVLLEALYNENYELASMLYEYGANPELEDPTGESAYSYFGVDNEEDFLRALEQ